jgi:hypothetical protein
MAIAIDPVGPEQAVSRSAGTGEPRAPSGLLPAAAARVTIAEVLSR